MDNTLVIVRVAGFLLGLIVSLWAFFRFRNHLVRRSEFILTFILGLAILLVSIQPSIINILADVMALSGRVYGRIIALLIISAMLNSILILGLRSKDLKRSIQFDLLVRKLAMRDFLRHSKKRINSPIFVILPALDEAENLKALLPELPARVLGKKVAYLVVDDGSTDNTVEVVERSGHLVVSNPINRGGGAALRLGYDLAMTMGAEIIVTMDSDGQHLPSEIEGLIKPILDNECDIVIGSRVLGSREKDSLIRWIGIHFFNFIINTLAGTSISDCSNGFRAFRTASLKKILLIQDQFHTAELIIDAAKKGIRIGEAPVTVMRRHSGFSKKGKSLLYGYNFSKTVIKTWLR